ncbi:MAG: putative sensor domain DACNV-containing protein [Pyrinomonadaceae bacterium]
MARQPTYQAARAVAAIVEDLFARHLAQARQRDERDLAHAPDARAIETMIDATFWASFRPEEGRFPKISLAFLPPEQASNALRFEQRLPLTPAILTKLAPAVERPGIHLGVWREEDELFVWGATRYIPSLGFVLEDIEPGLLVIKHRRIDGFGKFANVAVLKGEQIKIIDEQSTSLPDCPALLTSLLAFTSPATWHHSVNVLVQLAASMRAHGHGGTLLVVPPGTSRWRESIVHPLIYSVAPSSSRLATLIRKSSNAQSENEWQASLTNAVDTVAGLTAVDGATVISEDYEVLGFGAKIKRASGHEQVEQIVLTEPIVTNAAVVVPPVQHGGTRHLSAAQFIHDQRDSIALVASQDGRFTVFAWSPCEEMVHGHRVDVLLM